MGRWTIGAVVVERARAEFVLLAETETVLVVALVPVPEVEVVGSVAAVDSE